jgi:hypothetical protein
MFDRAFEKRKVGSSTLPLTTTTGALSVNSGNAEREGSRWRNRCPRVRKDLDAGSLEAEVASFALHMAAEGKAPRTIRTYPEAVRWFAAAYVLPETEKRRWEEADKADLKRWTVRLLGEYSTAYGGYQFRAIRRFLRWLAIEEDRPDPVRGLRAPTV